MEGSKTTQGWPDKEHGMAPSSARPPQSTQRPSATGTRSSSHHCFRQATQSSPGNGKTSSRRSEWLRPPRTSSLRRTHSCSSRTEEERAVLATGRDRQPVKAIPSNPSAQNCANGYSRRTSTAVWWLTVSSTNVNPHFSRTSRGRLGNWCTNFAPLIHRRARKSPLANRSPSTS